LTFTGKFDILTLKVIISLYELNIPMDNDFLPVIKQRLSDNLAQNISNYILNNRFSGGDRLPTISELSRLFGVGQPTLREAIKKLEAYGIVNVKHGSGIYVSDNFNRLFVSNPLVLTDIPIKKVLLDLIDARLSIEMQTISLATKNIRPEHIERMDNLLQKAKAEIENDDLLNHTNISFHLEIAAASGNLVFYQMLGVLLSLYRDEQQLLLQVYRFKERDHNQHVKIFEALRSKNKKLALGRMKRHLTGVRRSIEKWVPPMTTVG
jgi:GntR family transcriptional regulator, transcriptional repressor for pyruvate dehydrogenase complex